MSDKELLNYEIGGVSLNRWLTIFALIAAACAVLWQFGLL